MRTLLTLHSSLVIGQIKADEKSNEITAIPDLLDLPYIKGAIVSIDAAGCQKKIVRNRPEDHQTRWRVHHFPQRQPNEEKMHDEIRMFMQVTGKDL